MRTPRAKPRPIAGSPSRKGRYPRPARPVEPSPTPPPAHAALDGTGPRKGPPRPTAKAEPAPQAEGATLPRVEREGPTLIKVVDGLRGVVSRWECSATVLGRLASFTRLDGTAVRAHPVTVERHRGCAVEWVRGRALR